MRSRRSRLGPALVAALAAGALGFPALAVAASPYVRVVPSPATTGATVTVFGAEFCSTCGPVTITASGQTLGTVDVGGDGTFSTSIHLLLVPGQYVVSADQSGASGSHATTGLNVLPADNLASPGQQPPTAAPVVTAAPDAGSPSPPAGTAAPTVLPPVATGTAQTSSIRVIPNPAPTGTDVTIYGSGFDATGGEVTISAGGRNLATANVQADGSFTTSIKLGLTPGQYVLQADQGTAGGTHATVGLVVAVLDQASPNPQDGQSAATGPGTGLLLLIVIAVLAGIAAVAWRRGLFAGWSRPKG